LFSARRKAEGALAAFEAGFATTRNVVLEDATDAGSRPLMVAVSVLAADIINGRTVVRRFVGNWTLVQEQGMWKLDRGQIQQAP